MARRLGYGERREKGGRKGELDGSQSSKSYFIHSRALMLGVFVSMSFVTVSLTVCPPPSLEYFWFLMFSVLKGVVLTYVYLDAHATRRALILFPCFDFLKQPLLFE
ncbi:hypothetical protein QBC42DRAFT_272132 [Cladorrhinum samala]|uniref:Uncharacterized protein n=1 Tax=Cladorrhinum samala TaxID=585594 RepID=A0AAV9HKM1_9PEZI|nr:hypothetical protein QBC42DRAFT_272132 [Cladorrhinum samala]